MGLRERLALHSFQQEGEQVQWRLLGVLAKCPWRSRCQSGRQFLLIIIQETHDDSESRQSPRHPLQPSAKAGQISARSAVRFRACRRLYRNRGKPRCSRECHRITDGHLSSRRRIPCTLGIYCGDCVASPSSCTSRSEGVSALC